MGLFRLFWIPAGQSGEDGAYVHYPAEELLAILAIESHRARALVIGEDLGTVEPAMRQELRRRNVLSYRLLWFEENAIRQFPQKALTAVSTHDLFTLAGLWSGADFAEQEKLGLRPEPGEQRRLVKKLCRRIGIAERAEPSEVILKTYEYVAQAPSMLLAASLDDVLAVKERPNMPGTTNRPNWSLALPLPLEEIQKSPLVKKISRALGKTRKK
jgi:4-alpha-glucanotransferase